MADLCGVEEVGDGVWDEVETQITLLVSGRTSALDAAPKVAAMDLAKDLSWLRERRECRLSLLKHGGWGTAGAAAPDAVEGDVEAELLCEEAEKLRTCRSQLAAKEAQLEAQEAEITAVEQAQRQAKRGSNRGRAPAAGGGAGAAGEVERRALEQDLVRCREKVGDLKQRATETEVLGQQLRQQLREADAGLHTCGARQEALLADIRVAQREDAELSLEHRSLEAELRATEEAIEELSRGGASTPAAQVKEEAQRQARFEEAVQAVAKLPISLARSLSPPRNRGTQDAAEPKGVAAAGDEAARPSTLSNEIQRQQAIAQTRGRELQALAQDGPLKARVPETPKSSLSREAPQMAQLDQTIDDLERQMEMIAQQNQALEQRHRTTSPLPSPRR